MTLSITPRYMHTPRFSGLDDLSKRVEAAQAEEANKAAEAAINSKMQEYMGFLRSDIEILVVVGKQKISKRMDPLTILREDIPDKFKRRDDALRGESHALEIALARLKLMGLIETAVGPNEESLYRRTKVGKDVAESPLAGLEEVLKTLAKENLSK